MQMSKTFDPTAFETAMSPSPRLATARDPSASGILHNEAPISVCGAQFAVEKLTVGKLAHTPGTHCKESQPHDSVADAQDAAGLDHQFNHEVRHPGNMHKRNEKSPPEPIRHTDIRRQKLSNRTDSDGMNATKGEAMCTEYNFR